LAVSAVHRAIRIFITIRLQSVHVCPVGYIFDVHRTD
jgi:hypothetical protein